MSAPVTRARRDWRGPAGLELELAFIPAGEFIMGRADGNPPEQPRHRHLVRHGYWIARRPVTQAQYRAYTDATGATFPRQGWFRSRDDAPVTSVTWHEARAFCLWAGLALPSEAEWEKAARGVDGRLYPWGDDLRDLALHGAAPVAPLGLFVVGPSAGAQLAASERVASPFGLLEMVDGILEWCEDPFHPRVYLWYAHGDFAPPASGLERVVRGGAWPSRYDPLPVTARAHLAPDHRHRELGFRPVLRE